MDDPRPKNAPHSRHLVGGLSLLLLVTVTLATSAGGFQPLLAELSGQVSSERHIRAISGRLAEVVRSVARRTPTPAAIRPGPTWAAAPRTPSATRRALQAAADAPTLLVRVELLNLPPPRA